jgi:peptide/nickel transport system substrate-binding protein
MRSVDRRVVRLLALVAALGLVPLLVTPCAPEGRREVRIGLPSIPASLDPATALSGPIALIARQVFDTLVRYRAGTTDIEPSLATRWTISADGLTWTFTLREDVTFQDGAPLAARDVLASFQRLMVPDRPNAPNPNVVWPALLRGLPGVVKELHAPDPHTFQIVLVQPYAPLLTVLAHPGLGIVRAASGPDGTTRLAGSGPFRLVENAAGRVVLDATRPPGGNRVERLVFVEVPGDDEAEADFAAGTLDVWLPDLPPRRQENALSVPGTRMGLLVWATEKEPFNRKKVRQGIAAALDPALIGASLGHGAVPLQSFLPPGVWGRWEGPPLLGGNREASRRLLAAGGLPKSFTPTLLVPDLPGPVNPVQVAEAMATALAAAAVPIVTRVEPLDTVRALTQAGDYDMALIESSVEGGDPHLFLYPLSTTEGATKGPNALNVSFYRNPRLDDLLIRASQLAYRPERQHLYARAQALMAEELPWLPLYVRLRWAVVRPGVGGLRLHPTGLHQLDTLTVDQPAVSGPAVPGAAAGVLRGSGR